MKKIIVFLALIVSLFVGYGQPRTSAPSRQTTSTATVRTPSASRQPAASYSTSRPSKSPSRTVTTQRPSTQPAASYSTSRPSKSPSRTVTTQRPSTQPVARPSTQPVARPSTQPSRTVTTPSSNVSSRNIYNTRPATSQTVKRDGPAKPGDGHGGHGHNGHNPPPPNTGNHNSVPPGYNPPPRPPHHYPHNPHYHHPYYHRDVYLHRVYWNTWCPVIYLDGFWFYTHNNYFMDHGVRTTYVYTYNNTNTVQIIDYVVDDIYTYCIQKMGCDKYFRVYDKSNRLVAQQKIHWRYNELIYDTISGGVWCKGNRDNFNLFFVMDESGQLVCYSE